MLLDFMNIYVSQVIGNPLLALIGIELIYAVTMFIGRLSLIVMAPILILTFVVFSGLLWGSWITVFALIFSIIYLGYAILKWAGPPQ